MAIAILVVARSARRPSRVDLVRVLVDVDFEGPVVVEATVYGYEPA